MAVDAATGGISLTGDTQDASVDFGGGPLAADPGAAAGDGVFVLRLDAAGQHMWSRRFNLASSGENDLFDSGPLALDAQGSAVIAAAFAGTVDVAGQILQQGSPKLGYESLVLKLDASGGVVFAEPFGGPDPGALLELSGIAADAAGDIVIGGGFFGTIQVGKDLWKAGGARTCWSCSSPSSRPEATALLRLSRAPRGAYPAPASPAPRGAPPR